MSDPETLGPVYGPQQFPGPVPLGPYFDFGQGAGDRSETAADNDLQMLRVEPRFIDFGNVFMGGETTRMVEVWNDGPDQTTLTNIDIGTDGSLIAFPLGGFDIDPGGSLLVSLGFMPKVTGEQEGKVRFESDAYGDATVRTQGLGVQPSGDADPLTEVQAAPLKANYQRIDFKGDSGMYDVRVNTADIFTQKIVDVQLVGDEDFSLTLADWNRDYVDSNTPFGFQVAYRPMGTEPAKASYVDVINDQQQHLIIPVTAPQTLGDASMPGSTVLEISPQRIQFDMTAIGENAERHVTLLNRSLDAEKLGSAYVGTGGPFQASVWSGEVLPGQSQDMVIRFSPTDRGTFSDMVYLLADDHRTIAVIEVSGSAYAGADTITKESAKVDEQQKDEEIEIVDPSDPEARQMQMKAMMALQSWTAEADEAINRVHNSFIVEMNKFVHKAASNPTISPLTLPDDSFFVSMANNTFGNLASAVFEKKVIEKVAAKTEALLAQGAGGKALKFAGILLGPGGAIASFVVGVVLETLCGMLFDSLTGKDEEMRKALEEAYQKGFTDGARRAGEIMQRKLDLAVGKQNLAKAHQRRMESSYKRMIAQSTDLGQLAQLLAEVQTHTEDQRQVKADSKLGDTLLAAWVRDHAANPETAGKDVYKEEWERAAKEVRETDEKDGKEGVIGVGLQAPDMFVNQCINEWNTRGLTTPPELSRSIMSELGVKPGDTQFATPPGELAKLAHKRYDGREFVWHSVNLPNKGMESEVEHSRYAPDTFYAYTVYCYPHLATTDEGACYVMYWSYKIDHNNGVSTATTVPGQQEWTQGGKGMAGDSQEEQNKELYDVMNILRTAGATIERRGDADPSVVVPRMQHQDGRAESVVEFQVVETLTRLDGNWAPGELSLTDDVWKLLDRFEHQDSVGGGIVRGGDTILLYQSR